MRITIAIPDKEIEDAIRFTGAKTKREAIVTAVSDFNRRKGMAELVKHFGTCRGLMTRGALERLRRKD